MWFNKIKLPQIRDIKQITVSWSDINDYYIYCFLNI